MKVCVVEKNKQLGGNLQTFARSKQLFDTGVHYIGSLAPQQNLYQIFKYAGLMDKLNLEQMDTAFDKVLIEGDNRVYAQAQGWPAFKATLLKDFPEEKTAIENYHQKIKAVCEKFPLYHLSLDGDATEKFSVMHESVKEVMESLTKNKTLQSVWAGNNLLYAAVADKTPFYIHALIINSYIESSWKCVDGGSQIVKILSAEIRKHSGELIRNKSVTEIEVHEGLVQRLVLEDHSHIRAKQFISAISPSETLKILDTKLIKKNYRRRIESLSNTVSSFSLYIVLKEKTVTYENCNYYYQKKEAIWSLGDYNPDEWPLGYGLYFTKDKNNPTFASAISVLTLMKFDEVKPWSNSFNTTRFENCRGADYEAFKQQKSEQLLELVYERFPALKGNIKAHYAATPLTNRDYIGMHDGAIYGIQKNHQNPMQTLISPHTKIPNLFLTGQNLNLHGILGTSLTAILTCTSLLENSDLVDKIKNA